MVSKDLRVAAGSPVAPSAAQPAQPAPLQLLMWHRRRRARSRRIAFAALVLLPSLLVAAYLFLFASERFVSEARVVVHSDLGGGTSAVAFQTVLVHEYLKSHEAALDLDRALGLRRRFADPRIDFLSRLEANAPDEAFVNYFAERFAADIDLFTMVISLRVNAFSAQDAKAILDTALKLSEKKLNDAIGKRRDGLLVFARQELAEAKARLDQAEQRLAAYRVENREIDPLKTAGAIAEAVAKLYGQLVEKRATRAASRSVLTASSPAMKALNSEIAALERQIEAERARLARRGGAEISGRIVTYETLMLERELARGFYASVREYIATLEADTMRKHSYVIDFIPGQTPQIASEPNRLLYTGVVFVVASLLFGLASLWIAAIRDQDRL